MFGLALAQEAPPIVNGQTTSDYPAVGALIACGSSCFSFCSGTYVQDRWVVTAAHCVAPLQSYANSGYTVWFGVGPQLGQLTESDEIVDWEQHPQYNSSSLAHDIGVVKLKDGLSVDPIPVNQRKVDNGWVGRELHYVGYGVTGDNSDDGGVKRTAAMPIDSVGSQFVYTEDIGDGQNICYGDSGGAALESLGGGRFELVAANSHVYGVSSNWTMCIGGGSGATRVDAHMDWLKGFFDPNVDAPEEEPEEQPEEEPEEQPEEEQPGDTGDPNDPNASFVAWSVPIVVPQGGEARTRIFTDPEGPADLLIVEEPLYGTAEVGQDGWVHFVADGQHVGGDWLAVVVSRGGQEQIVQVDIEIAERADDIGCTTGDSGGGSAWGAGWLALGLLISRGRRGPGPGRSPRPE